MQANLTNRSVGQAIAAIEALDLEPIKLRVMDAESGEGWTSEYADGIERGYRSYLRMLVKHPGDIEDIVVSKEVDEFWHAHILHTMKYTEDCEKVFGTYVHHNPHVGKRTAEDVQNKVALVEKTRQLYQEDLLENPMHRVSRVAYRSAAIGPQEVAYCSAAVRAGNAAYCSAAVRARDTAYCSASIKVEDQAYCSAAIKSRQVAYCSAAVSAGNAAYCSAAVRAYESAYCSASIKVEDQAYCSAAIKPQQQVAYCSAAVKAGNAAYCSAAVRACDTAYCSASIKAEDQAYCSAAIGKERTAVHRTVA